MKTKTVLNQTGNIFNPGKHIFLVWLMIILVSVNFYACTKKQEKDNQSSSQEQVKTVKEEVQEHALPDSVYENRSPNLEQENPIPVHYRYLKALLPENLPGMKRTRVTAQRLKVRGKFTRASGKYVAKSGLIYKYITINIIDLGRQKNLNPPELAWMHTGFEREIENGYERTTRYKNYPTLERYEQLGEFTRIKYMVVVDNRFVVEVQGENVSLNRVKMALNHIDLEKLKLLAKIK